MSKPKNKTLEMTLDILNNIDDSFLTPEILKQEQSIVDSFDYNSKIDNNILESAQKVSVFPIFRYINETAGEPLLSHDEEIELSKIIQKARDKNATEKEKEAANFAKNMLIEKNLRLVVHCVKGFNYPNIEMVDLIQEGILGLIRSIEKYDYKLGFRFATYATWWIRQTISRSAPELSRTIRIPSYLNGKNVKVKKIINVLQLKGIEPTYEAIAEHSNGLLTVEEVRKSIEETMDALSYDSAVYTGDDGNGETSSIFDYVDFGQVNTVDDFITNDTIKIVIEKLMSSLTPQEKTVITMFFGLKQSIPMRLKDISVVMGVSRERIRQVKEKALVKMSDTAVKNNIDITVLFKDSEVMI